MLHPVGSAVVRCLAACSLAERDERIPSPTLHLLAGLKSSISQSMTLTPKDKLFYEAIGRSTVNLTNLVISLFRIVDDHNLLDGFVSPTIPDAAKFVPDLQTAVLQSDSVGVRSESKTSFGRLITEWPISRLDVNSE